MEGFELKGYDAYLKISFQEVYGYPKDTCHWGGYDTRSLLEIFSDDFEIRSSFHVSTGEIFEFYKSLSYCNEVLKGNVHFVSYEGNLDFNIEYDVNGRLSVKGSFSKQNEMYNKLTFHFTSDQTFIQATLKQLKMIVEKYGDNKGIK